MDITETLRLHALWTTGGAKGERANLRGADLWSADLRGADLEGAIKARLGQTGAGYQLFAVERDGETRIVAGCRDFSIEEALVHWGAADYHTPSDGRRTCALVQWWVSEQTGRE